MHIAIVGTGIAGNTAAFLLSQRYQVTVYERELRPGGHSHTVEIDYDGRRIAVDTGFIVYNEVNYPGLTALFASLGVPTKPSDMGFSVSIDNGRFEWAGRETSVPRGLFAQRRNVLSWPHIRMLLEILKFQKVARADLAAGRLEGLTLGGWLSLRGFSKRLRDRYIVPMGAAIWSTPVSQMLEFPAESFFSFCENHSLLQWYRPKWRTVEGGSRVYVDKMIAHYRDRLRLGAAVTRVERSASGVTITDALGLVERYDAVVIAAHSDQALTMLADPTANEQDILGSIGYAPNQIYLHRDPRLMPRRRDAWTSWNYLASSRGDGTSAVTVSYWMNALQGIDAARPLFLTLNPPFEPDPALTFWRHMAMHPVFDAAALAAQRRVHTLQGQNRTWYAGAWTGHGFHEDGLRSGVAVAEALGVIAPWNTASHPLAEAAE